MECDEAQEFPREIVKKAAELGLLRASIFPEEYGGAGLGYVEYVIVVEELSRVDGSIGISVAAHNSLCTNHIFTCGNGAAAASLRAEARLRRVDRRLEPDRADGGQRRRRDAHDRAARRRRRLGR